MILSLLATNVLLASSFIVFVFLRVTLIKIECKIPLLSLLIVINLCSFAGLLLVDLCADSRCFYRIFTHSQKEVLNF